MAETDMVVNTSSFNKNFVFRGYLHLSWAIYMYKNS